MQSQPSTADIVPDSEHRGLVGRLPPTLRGLALLARFDRPIGWWLLFWPGAWGVALAGGAVERWDLILWLLLGSIAMRGAGCVFNDIIDRDLDRKVERTRSRQTFQLSPVQQARLDPVGKIVQALERAARIANGIGAGIGWMTVAVALARARNRELGLKRFQQV